MLKTGLSVIVLLTMLLLSGCAGISERVFQRPLDATQAVERAEVRQLVDIIKERNKKLNTFKGTGKIKLWRQGEILTTRVAWAGSYPDKLRIALRSVSGQPTESLATDGQWLYLISHIKQKFYKKRTSNPTLQDLISIPITASDIVSILCARVPIREYHFAEFASAGSVGEYVLVLKKKWQGAIEKIYFDQGKKTIKQIEVFDGSGIMLYRATFIRMQQINDFEVPLQLLVSNRNGDRFQLDIERYWAGITLSPSIFVLAPPQPD